MLQKQMTSRLRVSYIYPVNAVCSHRMQIPPTNDTIHTLQKTLSPQNVLLQMQTRLIKKCSRFWHSL